MSYRVATTVRGIEVRLYEDGLERIFRKHGELRGTQSLILETVTSPDLVLAGHGSELLAVKHHEPPVGPKDMVVVYREDRQLIITAFLTSDRNKLLRKRRTLWQGQSR